MEIHYFQRYHSKENVATANTLLLLSRLYSYSSHKFFELLKSHYLPDSFSPEIVFRLQEKNDDSIPDATITQNSFKLVVETKMFDWFDNIQLMHHLKSFHDEQVKVLITLAPEYMAADKKLGFEEKLKEYNQTQATPILHINTTFKDLTDAFAEVLDDRDYELRDILDDYLDYCYTDHLILGHDSWKFMRMQLAGATLDFNMQENVYYDNADRGFRAHDYLGLYKNKSVRAVGKIIARITAIETPNGTEYEAEFGELTDERKKKIQESILDGDSHGYDLRTIKHRYFFVEKFYETDFRKVTPRPPMGTRIFDLTQVLGIDKMPDTQKVAELLAAETWN